MRVSSLVAGTVAFAMSATSVYAAQCSNDVWKNVMSRGKVVVGVKAETK